MPSTSFNWRKVNELLFVDLPALFRTIHDELGIRKALSLPHSGEIATASELLDQAVASDGLYLASLDPGSKEILTFVWRYGWLLPQKTARGVRYVFASPMYRW
jgi:hypothetical protein